MYENNEAMAIMIIICAGGGLVFGGTFLVVDFIYFEYMPSLAWTIGIVMTTFFGLLLAAAWVVDKLLNSKGQQK